MTEIKKNEEKLSDIYNIKIGDTERTVKMSFGMAQKIAGLFTDTAQMENFDTDFGMQIRIMNELLAERDENGSRTKPMKDYTLDLDKDEGEKLLEWASKHIMNFFTLRLEAQIQALEKMRPLLEELQKANQEVATASNESK